MTPKLNNKTYEHPIRSRRIKIYPTREQREGLNSWFGAVRFCYNLLVAKFKNVGQGNINLETLRQVITEARQANPWLEEIHYDVRDVAVMDFDKARKAHFAKLNKMRQTDPNARLDATFKFRSKRDLQQSVQVATDELFRGRGKFAFINLNTLQPFKKLKEHAEKRGEEYKLPKLECSVRFVKDRLNHYYLIIPGQVAPSKDENQIPMKTVALDPGDRTFQTTYDCSGLSSEWGKDDKQQLFRLCRLTDKLQSKWQKKDVKAKRRHSLKCAWYRSLDRIKAKVKEVHIKMTKWLCENYKVILIPKFETSQMTRRTLRKLNGQTARSLLTWSHYKFREMLKAKAELYPGVKVVVCGEAYTSKTCGSCGVIHTTLGGSKTFRCKHCGLVAARNILLRYLSLS